jgi:hypothetical protein
VGRLSRKVEEAGGWLGRLDRNLKENYFQNKNWIFEYTKTLEICTRRFRRNFDMGIFLNSSRLVKDFRKIKYAMPYNASYAILFFWKDFYTHVNLICNLYALLCWQNFILAKSGCYSIAP